MATKLLSSITRYIGLSTDRKPTDCNNGSTYLELDTGDMYVFSKDGVWSLKDEASIALRREVIKRADALMRELKLVNENLLSVIEALNG
jgi:hypothetical protein